MKGNIPNSGNKTAVKNDVIAIWMQSIGKVFNKVQNES